MGFSTQALRIPALPIVLNEQINAGGTIAGGDKADAWTGWRNMMPATSVSDYVF